jgi:hypothetical protein
MDSAFGGMTVKTEPQHAPHPSVCRHLCTRRWRTRARPPAHSFKTPHRNPPTRCDASRRRLRLSTGRSVAAGGFLVTERPGRLRCRCRRQVGADRRRSGCLVKARAAVRSSWTRLRSNKHLAQLRGTRRWRYRRPAVATLRSMRPVGPTWARRQPKLEGATTSARASPRYRRRQEGGMSSSARASATSAHARISRYAGQAGVLEHDAKQPSDNCLPRPACGRFTATCRA